MAHECSTPYIYHGYYIFPMTKMQYFMHSKDEYEYYRSGNEHFHLNDKYFWINPNTFLLESFTSIEDAKKVCDLIIDRN